MRQSLLAALIGAAWLTVCGSNAAFLAERSRTEAHLLQETCKRFKLDRSEVKRGDELIGQSDQFWKDGKAEPARVTSEEAQVYFQIALTSYEEARVKSQADSVSAALNRDKEKLATYSEILDEMKKTRKP
jgi:hypothetical protein